MLVEVCFLRAYPPHSEELAVWKTTFVVNRMSQIKVQVVVTISRLGIEASPYCAHCVVWMYSGVREVHTQFGISKCELDGMVAAVDILHPGFEFILCASEDGKAVIDVALEDQWLFMMLWEDFLFKCSHKNVG